MPVRKHCDEAAYSKTEEPLPAEAARLERMVSMLLMTVLLASASSVCTSLIISSQEITLVYRHAISLFPALAMWLERPRK